MTPNRRTAPPISFVIALVTILAAQPLAAQSAKGNLPPSRPHPQQFPQGNQPPASPGELPPAAPQNTDAKPIALWFNSREFVANWIHVVPVPDPDRLALLRAKFVKFECAPGLQPTPNQGDNLICTLPGESRDIIVVGAHYEHPGKGVGAIENWSGAAMLPLLYHAMQITKRHFTFVFVAFDGKKGAQTFFKRLSTEERGQVRAVFDLDALGLSPTRSCSFPDNSPRFLQDLSLEQALLSVARTLGTRNMPHGESCYEMIKVDDTDPFRKAGIPALIIHSVTHEKHSLPGSERDTADAIDPASYYNTYQLLEIYLSVIDLNLTAVIRPGAYDPIRSALMISGVKPHSAAKAAGEPASAANLPPLPPPGAAPTPAPPGIVTIDVVATTKDGQPATGLTRDQFQVIEDEQQQQITSFEDHTAKRSESTSFSKTDADPGPLANDGTVRSASQSTPPASNYHTNAQPRSESPIVLIVDSLNTPGSDALFERKSMIALLKTIPPQSHIAVFGLGSRLWMFQGLATDSTALLAAVDSVTEKLRAPTNATPAPAPLFPTHLETVLAEFETDPDLRKCFGNEPRTLGVPAPQPQEEQSSQTEAVRHGCEFSSQTRTQHTLEGFQQVLRYLDGAAGRKSIVWFSQAFPLPLTPDRLTSTARSMGEINLEDAMVYSNNMVQLAAQLREARVSIYPVNSAGINTIRSGILAPANAAPANKEEPQPTGTDLTYGFLRKIFSIWGEPREQLRDMTSVANATGGRAFAKTDEISKAVATAAADNADSFTLSYSPANTAHEQAFHSIEIRTSGTQYGLAYPRGYFDQPSPPLPASDRQRLTEEKLDPLFVNALKPGLPPAAQILFNARATRTAEKPGAVTFRLDFNAGYDAPAAAASGLNPPAAPKERLLFAVSASDAAGKQVASSWQPLELDLTSEGRAKLAADGAPFQMELDVPTSAATLTLGVYDPATQRIGTLDILIVSDAAR